MHNYDVVVIGGGLAGVTAARDLVDDGQRVILLEARESLGGRTSSGPFGDTGIMVDWGGEYVSAANHFVRRELLRYGLFVGAAPAAQNYMHLLGGRRLETEIPIAPGDAREFERTAFDVLQKASTLRPDTPLHEQVADELNVSWKSYLDEVAPAPGVRDLFDSMALDFSGRPTGDFSALLMFWFVAQLGNSLAAFHSHFDGKIQGGVRALMRAMTEGVEIRLNTPVVSVEQSASIVRCETADGEIVAASAGVFAIPVNCWNDVAFDPPLGAAKTRASALRPGSRGLKGWALVQDAPPGLSGHSSLEAGRGVVLVAPGGQVEETQLLSLFSPLGYEPGTSGDEFDVNDRTHVQRALEAYAPGCRVLQCAGLDWNRDRYFNGSWGSYPPELFACFPEIRELEGRVAFVGADIAEGFAVWIDGAIQSGSRGAREITAVLETARS